MRSPDIVVVDLLEYEALYRVVVMRVVVARRSLDLQLEALVYYIPQDGERLYCSFYPMLTKVLGFECIGRRQPSIWVHNRLARLQTWCTSLGAKAIIL